MLFGHGLQVENVLALHSSLLGMPRSPSLSCPLFPPAQLLRLLFLIEYKGDLRPSSNYNSCYHTDASSDSREAQDRETSVSSENSQVHDTEEKQEEVV